MSEAGDCVVALWHAMESRDWSKVADLLSPEFRAEFPQSAERFDRSGFLKLNRDYPGDWHIQIRHLVDGGEWVVTEIEVEIDGRTDRGVSFFRVHNGRIVSIREFWPEAFPVPEWRRGSALNE